MDMFISISFYKSDCFKHFNVFISDFNLIL